MTDQPQPDTSEALRRVELIQERARVREEEQDRANRAVADLILGQGVVLDVSGVGLTWPDTTPTAVIEEAEQLAHQILGRER